MTYSIIVEPEAIQDLKAIKHYISKQDSSSKADKFILELKNSIASLSSRPMRCRQSLYIENDTVRDMIHKGYTIVYQVNEENQTVYVLTVFRQRIF